MKKKKLHIITPTIKALGSWPSLFIMAAVSIGWWAYTFYVGHPGDTLDHAVSIWTELLDVIVLIAFNYTRSKDQKTMKRIEEDIADIKDMAEQLLEDKEF